MNYLATGQNACYDGRGVEIPCEISEQDGQFRSGVVVSGKRFLIEGEIIRDTLTGLQWPVTADLAKFPVTWNEALVWVNRLNDAALYGYGDWRLPNRRELHSILDYQQTRPAIDRSLNFVNLFQSWYWTSTTAVISPSHAWCVELSGGRLIYGGKNQFFMTLPVRGALTAHIAKTGQSRCYDDRGKLQACQGSGQDGEYEVGIAWPNPRFFCQDNIVFDNLTALSWTQSADITGCAVDWQTALAAIKSLNTVPKHTPKRAARWRLPNINELESLIDASRARPALPVSHLFESVQDVYWSSTTSVYQPDWAWALYLDKGALGVGHKQEARFYVWAVTGP